MSQKLSISVSRGFLEKNSISVHDEAAIAARYIGEEAKAEHRVRAVILGNPIIPVSWLFSRTTLLVLCQTSACLGAEVKCKLRLG